MPQWATFAGITGVVLVLLLVLSHLTQSSFSDGADSSGRSSSSETPSSSDDADSPFESTPFESATEHDSRTTVDSQSSESADSVSPPLEDERVSSERSVPASTDDEPSAPASTGDKPPAPDSASETGETAEWNGSGPLEEDSDRVEPTDEIDPASLSTRMVLANVALSQGLFALVLLGAVIYTGIPVAALGVEFSWSYLWTGVLVGTGAGLVLYVANEIGAAVATHAGFDHDEQLRELLAPDSAGGWVVLLVGVLPIIAVFEELLFRAALIGALSVGFGIDPWLLAVVSSIAFALGHGMQGSVGIVVTGALGFVLAAVFVLSGSFLVVVVAHYWINALEFVVHEGLELEWAETLES